MNPDVSILGLGASGVAAARLALNKGGKVYVSDTRSDPAVATRGAELEALGARVELGRHDVERIAASGTVVVSPGIAPDAPVLRALGARHVAWISEPEFAIRFYQSPLIAVTGTNGKTTTSALTAHLLRAGGIDAALGGNIGAGLGPPASELALREPAPAWYVLEVSSFQLAYVDRFRPAIGVVTNLAPDHLDRYDGIGAYYADKARLFDSADHDSRWVLNADDPAVLELAGDAPGRRSYFSTKRVVDGGSLEDGRLTLGRGDRRTPLLPRDDLPLLGDHNVANALAAAVAAWLAGVDEGLLGDGLRGARPLPHRLEPVAEVNGVLWVNDSKATNVAAAASAVRSLAGTLVLLLGGKDKGEDFGALRGALMGRVRRVLAYGAAGPRIRAELTGHVDVELVEGGLDDVVRVARSVAAPGDVVLLAPACSSFDMFESYEERGALFRELAREGAA
ncbi:MAG TPA: UDP-N-acetylmuramoyl-L-alanine--D-glutamate ligase [Longimicrobiales bacterium]